MCAILTPRLIKSRLSGGDPASPGTNKEASDEQGQGYSRAHTAMPYAPVMSSALAASIAVGSGVKLAPLLSLRACMPASRFSGTGRCMDRSDKMTHVDLGDDDAPTEEGKTIIGSLKSHG
jgi:hypothetical protein